MLGQESCRVKRLSGIGEEMHWHGVAVVGRQGHQAIQDNRYGNEQHQRHSIMNSTGMRM